MPFQIFQTRHQLVAFLDWGTLGGIGARFLGRRHDHGDNFHVGAYVYKMTVYTQRSSQALPAVATSKRR